MARSNPPKYIGVVRLLTFSNIDWIQIAWAVDSQHIRIETRQPTSIEKKAFEQGKLVMLKEGELSSYYG